MEKIRILLLRPEGNDISPTDQSFAAHLSAPPEVVIEEQRFRRDDGTSDLEERLAPWKGKVAGVVGAVRVPESRRLGELAEQMDLLCFVANNNPSVWQRRRHIFHIGLPTTQTTAAVAAALVQKTNRRRFLLLHDQNEFQSRVAATMEAALAIHGMEVKSQAQSPDEPVIFPSGWPPELVYVVFSNEPKALPIVRAIREQAPDIPILFGRSLLRESFLAALGKHDGEFWFVDTVFRRSRLHTESQQEFMQAMAANGINIPTTNHAFGWDAMKFCAHALNVAQADPSAAIDYLESGVALEGASGTCFFSPDNHNGRLGLGPTIVSRWINGRLEDA
jgi:ABC-type branched-subunit amino acid transport system substrate-binding protein